MSLNIIINLIWHYTIINHIALFFNYKTISDILNIFVYILCICAYLYRLVFEIAKKIQMHEYHAVPHILS